MSHDVQLDAHGADATGHGRRSARETLEDYTLRYAPRSYRRWAPPVVATTALGGIAYLADFAIGANIGLAHGTGNALLGILVAAVAIFLTGLPLAYYSARYNIDLDLVTRGAGFGYYGSVITNVIFATYTFIFFALEGSIMAQGLLLGLHIPLWLGYLVSSLLVIPLVVYGMRALSQLQVWTTPLWLVLMVGPIGYLMATDPASVGHWLAFPGTAGHGGVSFAAVMLSAGVVVSLIGQIGEQVDYLRFMPPRTAANRRSWWAAVILAGPGWVALAVLKQAMGVFLAVYALGRVTPAAAAEPIHQFVVALDQAVPAWLALALAVVLVVLSQIKINVTNAYSGSLAWTNSFTRVSKHYPGRLVFVFFNVGVALVLMEANMFSFLGSVLSFYSNCGIAWIVTVATDVVVNKHLLGLSPKKPEFRRTMLYAVNPVGMVSFGLSSGLSIAAYFGALGAGLAPYSPIVAVVVALVATPVMAVLTRGRYYLRRTDDGLAQPRFEPDGTPAAGDYTCHACHEVYERPDVLGCQVHGEPICSLCLTTDRHGVHFLPTR